jgi:hypothetical protein
MQSFFGRMPNRRPEAIFFPNKFRIQPSSLSGLKPKYSFSLRYKKHSEMLKLHPF